MKISARNHLSGTVQDVIAGAVNAEVTLALARASPARLIGSFYG